MGSPDPGIDRAAHAAESSNYRKHLSGNPLQRALINRFHHRILSEIAELQPSTLLDAGCGEGIVARLIHERFPAVLLTGIDASPGAIAIATRDNPEATFLIGSVLELPFPDDAFDVVGCFEVLEHLPGDLPAKALAEYARVARRAVVLSVPHEPWFCRANAARGKNWEVRPRGSDPDHHQFWSSQAFGDLVSRNFEVRTLTTSFPWTICVADVQKTASNG